MPSPVFMKHFCSLAIHVKARSVSVKNSQHPSPVSDAAVAVGSSPPPVQLMSRNIVTPVHDATAIPRSAGALGQRRASIEAQGAQNISSSHGKERAENGDMSCELARAQLHAKGPRPKRQNAPAPKVLLKPGWQHLSTATGR